MCAVPYCIEGSSLPQVGISRFCISSRQDNHLPLPQACLTQDTSSAGKLFDRYIQMERSLGNTEMVATLEKRRRDMLGESPVSDINLMLLKYWCALSPLATALILWHIAISCLIHTRPGKHKSPSHHALLLWVFLGHNQLACVSAKSTHTAHIYMKHAKGPT